MEHPDEAVLLGPDAHLAIPDGGMDMETKAKLGLLPEAEDAADACEQAPCGHEEAQAGSITVVPDGTTQLIEMKPPAPVPVMRGRFAVYDTPDGGYHLTYQLEGEDKPEHMEFPGMLVALAKKRGAAVGGMSGFGGFAKLFGGE